MRDDVDGFMFKDPTGLIRWITPDRGTVTLGPVEAAEREREVVDLVARWIRA